MEKSAFRPTQEIVPELTGIDSLAVARLVRERTGDLGIQVRIVMNPAKGYEEIIDQIFSGKRTMDVRSFHSGGSGYLDLTLVFGKSNP